MVDAQSGRLRRWLLLGSILLILVLFLCTCNGSSRIQGDLVQRGQLALREGGFDPSLLSVNGRDATLSGVSLSNDAKAEMLALVGGVRGMRLVNDDLRVEAAAPTPSELVFSAFDDSVTLTGTVPEGARADIVAAAEELYPDAVTDNLVIAPEGETPAWLGGVLGALPQVKEATTDVELSVQADALTLEGSAVSEEARAELGNTLSNAANLEVDNRLAVEGEPAADAADVGATDTDTAGAADVADTTSEADTTTADTDVDADATDTLSPSFSLDLSPSGAALTGVVDPATRDALTNATSGLPGREAPTDNLSVEEAVAAPSWLPGLVNLLPDLDAGIDGAGLDVEGDQVTLRGEVQSEAERAALEDTLRSTLGPDVTVRNELAVVEASAQAQPEVAPQDAETETSAEADSAEAETDSLAGIETDAEVDPETTGETAEADAESAAQEEAEASVEAEETDTDADEGTATEEAASVESADDDGSANEVAEASAEVTEEALDASEAEADSSEAASGAEASNTETSGEATTEVEVTAEVEDSSETEAAEASADSESSEAVSSAEASSDEVSGEEDTEVEVSDAETDEAAGEAVSSETTAESDTSNEAATAAETAGAEVEVSPETTDAVADTAEVETEAASETTDPDAATTASESEVESVTPPAPEAAALREPEVRVAVLGDSVELSGTVATQEEFRLAETAFPGKTVKNSLRIDPEVKSPEWLADLYELSLRVDGNANRPILEVKDGTLTLQGSVASEAMRGAVGDYVGDGLPPLTLDNRLEVQPLIPFSEDGK